MNPMTNGHSSGHAHPETDTAQVVLQVPPQAARAVRGTGRVLRYLLPFLLGGAAGKTCSVREERPRVSAAPPAEAAKAEQCTPPCPPGQTCRGDTCYAVATEGTKGVASAECLPAVEIIFRTKQ
jgi:hypothetical protein